MNLHEAAKLAMAGGAFTHEDWHETAYVIAKTRGDSEPYLVMVQGGAQSRIYNQINLSELLSEGFQSYSATCPACGRGKP